MIEINNLTANSVDEGRVREIVGFVLRKEGKGQSDLSIAFVGEGRMRELNRKYQGKNRSTDVLSFPEQKPFDKALSQEGNGIGELVISLRQVKKNSKRYGVPYEQEFAMILIHGTLHLLGYEHEKSKKDSKIMFEKQNRYLGTITNTSTIYNASR